MYRFVSTVKTEQGTLLGCRTPLIINNLPNSLTQCKKEVCIVTVIQRQKKLACNRKLMENFKDFSTIYNLEKEYQKLGCKNA